MAKQIFKVRPVDIPYSAMILGDGPHVSSQHIEMFPFTYWPGGAPCDVLNMYLLDVAHETTGASLATFASELSHLVRYCWKSQLAIAELTDDDICALSTQLQEEKSVSRPTERVRNNNTVRGILSRAIQFLLWYQKHIVLATSIPLIGEATISPQIIIKRVRNHRKKSRRAPEYYYTHRSMPQSVTREPKRPIALPVIEMIEQSVDSLSDLAAQSDKFLQRYRNRPNLLIAHLEYIRIRRHFMIWLLKRTGLRPSEMVEISISEHLGILHSKRILIPIKKRRRMDAPMRSFPITLKDATVFQRYLTARAKYCEALKSSGQLTPTTDALFLGLDGTSIKKTSLERDFSRIVAKAGFKDVQVCFSMFRHRFITYEVIVHLKEFMASTGKTAKMMTESDNESILKRVAAKTGHGSVQSLWHYIDLAWEEINVWGNVDIALERLHSADRLYDELLNLKHELDILKTAPATRRVVREIATKLGKIVKSGRQDIQTTGTRE